MSNSIKRSRQLFVVLLMLGQVAIYRTQGVRAAEELKRSFEALHMTEAKQLVSRIHELVDELSDGNVENPQAMNLLIRSQSRKLVLLIVNDASGDSLKKKVDRLEEGKLLACKDQNETCESVFSEEIQRISSDRHEDADNSGHNRLKKVIGLVALANRLALKKNLS